MNLCSWPCTNSLRMKDDNPAVFQVLETNRNEESQSHVHRMYFMGPNTFSEPWYLPHSPPEQVTELV